MERVCELCLVKESTGAASGCGQAADGQHSWRVPAGDGRWRLRPGHASEEEIDQARTILLGVLPEATSGLKRNALFAAMIRLSADLEETP